MDECLKTIARGQFWNQASIVNNEEFINSSVLRSQDDLPPVGKGVMWKP